MKRPQKQRSAVNILCAIATAAGLTFIAGCVGTSAPFGAGQPPTATLANTYWQLTHVTGHSPSAGEQKRQPYLLLTSDKNKFRGFSGCNTIHGRYKRSDDQLRFTAIAQTRMACRGRMQTEQALLAALDQTRRMRIENQTLVLIDAAGQVLARFDARVKQFGID